MVNIQGTENVKFQDLKRWFIENPKLPQEIDDLLLKRFLKCMNGNVDETKHLIEHNYTLRNKNPHIFLDRDPADKNMEEFHALHDIIPLPGLTPEKYKVQLFRLNHCEPNKMNSVLESKVFYMMSDCRFTMLDVDNLDMSENNNFSSTNEDCEFESKMADGDVQIIDIGNYTLSHLLRISFFTLRTQFKFLQEAFPVHLRAMHIINCPTYLDRMIAIIKPFIRDDVYNMMKFHIDGLESLYEHVPRELLPNEYGGQAGTVEELKGKWIKILEQKRTYLMDPKQWKVEQDRSRWLFW